uniref:Uma2 family endonuclease n=1 Tax=uncultured Caulobacter sp. TaxID=158749 RepID=UPI0025F6F002|nr:Uma2 family endonuclease [uncultured Caulobacter sp.]
MNAPVRLLQTPRHRFTPEEALILRKAGIVPPENKVALVDGMLVSEEAQPFRFTLDEVFHMVELGVLDPDARVELIDGELVEMSPQNAPHMEAKRYLLTLFVRQLADDVAVQVEGSLRLAPRVSPSPDIWLHSTAIRVDHARGPDVLLLVEVADSSLLRDLNLKAELYARHGVPDYWVVDAYGRRIFVHRQPTPEGYAEVLEIGRETGIAPLAFPELVIRPGDLPVID